MADKSSFGDKKVKNALLTAASSGFSFEDFSDARLLVPIPVPVSVQEEILKNTPEATSEIDLQSDDVEEDESPFVVPVSAPVPQHVTSFENLPNEGVTKPTRDSSFISFFKKSSNEKDHPQSSIFPFLRDTAATTTTTPIIAPVTAPLKTSPVVESIPQTTTEKPPSPPPSIPLFSGLSSTSTSDPFSFPVSVQPPPPPSLSVSGLPPPPVSASASGLPHQLSSVAGPASTTTITTSSLGDSASTTYAPSAPPLVPVAQSATTDSGDILKFSAKTPQDVVGPSSTGNVKGTSNKYTLGKKRPQYAQYPGLLPNVHPQMANMGNLTSQQPPLVPPVAGPINPPPSNVSNNLISSTTATYSQDYAGTGYVFGEPPPLKVVSTPSTTPIQYSSVTQHWFYHKEVEGKSIWKPFSFLDSVALEDAFSNGRIAVTSTDGGRYDVDVMHRLRTPVYWEEAPSEVRRCSWFYKGPLDNRFIPYDEDFAQQLEEEFSAAIATGIWQRRIELGGGEAIILHSPTVMVHFCQAASPDEWGNLPESQLRPRVVKRGVDKSFLIEDGESTQIDHLVFIVHGIGAICDFKFRSIVEAVDDFRSLSAQLLHTHFGTAVYKGLAGRIEFLPVGWHAALHGDCGVDRKLKPITLHSIPKLRNFTNDTLLDILFYTSPVYCKRIVDTVGNEINRMYDKFLKRNLDFDGSVSLAGHSLGSLILFDLLTHQPVNLRMPTTNDKSSETLVQSSEAEETCSQKDADAGTSGSKLVSYTIGQAGTGQPSIIYPAFDFHPTCFFAMGSPIAVFISVRGIEQLGHEFKLPTCPRFFNVFHPYDPVAYRMETLIDPTFAHAPVVIPHHKGRKRFHLEIKDAMFRMGTDLKQTMVETFKNTWRTFYHLASFGRSDDPKLEQEINQVLEGELDKTVETQQLTEQASQAAIDITIGQLNGGRRIDYVLQEGPLESFNEYLFALSSHVCYWESEDTMLLLMREIYNTMSVFPDNHPSMYSQQLAETPSMEFSGQFPGGENLPPPPFSYGNSTTNNYSQNSYPPANVLSYTQASTAAVSMYSSTPSIEVGATAPPPPIPFTPASYSFVKTPRQSHINTSNLGQFVPQQQPSTAASPFVPQQQPLTTASPFVPQQQPLTTESPFVPQQQPLTTASPFVPQPVATASPFVPQQQPLTTASPFVPQQQPLTTASPFVPQQQPLTTASPFVPQQQPLTTASPFVPQPVATASPFVPPSSTMQQPPVIQQQQHGSTSPLPGVISSSHNNYSVPNVNWSQPVLPSPRDTSPHITNNLSFPSHTQLSSDVRPNSAMPTNPLGPPPLSGFVRKS